MDALFHSFYNMIYTASWEVALLAPAIVLLLRGAWAFLSPERKAGKRGFFAAGFVLWLLTAAAFTLIFDRDDIVKAADGLPFASIRQFIATKNPETLRAFWMNVLLFVPGGLCLAGLLPGKPKDRPFVSALIRFLIAGFVGLALSTVIETVQQRMDRGVFQMDDLIANAAGAMLGALPELVAGMFLGFLAWKPKNAFLKKLVELGNQKWHVVSYLFWGGTTTFMNWLSFFLLSDRIDLLLSNILAWLIQVGISFYANRTFVFKSDSKGWAVLKEGVMFAAGHLLSLVLETTLLGVGVRVLHFPKTPVKILVAVINAVMNFFLGKLLIFRKKTPQQAKESI